MRHVRPIPPEILAQIEREDVELNLQRMRDAARFPSRSDILLAIVGGFVLTLCFFAAIAPEPHRYTQEVAVDR